MEVATPLPVLCWTLLPLPLIWQILVRGEGFPIK